MRPQAANQYRTVAFHNIDRAYGGAEEGGWYYDCGEPCAELKEHTRTIKNRNAAERHLSRLTKMEAELNEGCRPIYSVAYDGDAVQAIMQRGTIPHEWPTERPHYE